VVEVEIVGGADGRERSGLARALAEAAGAVFRSPPGRTWVRLSWLPPEQYAENAAEPPPGDLPVFVSVLQRRNPEGSALAAEVRRLTVAIAQAIGRSADRIHVRYEAAAAGRQAFGGRLVGE